MRRFYKNKSSIPYELKNESEPIILIAFILFSDTLVVERSVSHPGVPMHGNSTKQTELDPIEFPVGLRGRIVVWYRLEFHVSASDGGGGFLGHYRTQEQAEAAAKKNCLEELLKNNDRTSITPVKVFTFGHGTKGLLLGIDFSQTERVATIGGKFGPVLW